MKSVVLAIIILMLCQNGFAENGMFNFTRFKSSYLPEGICTDLSGYPVVASVDPNNTFQEFVTRYSATGSVLNQVIYSNTGRMKFDGQMNRIWMLIDKQFYLIDPADFSYTPFLDISAMNINTSQIYDISLGQSFPVPLNPQNAIYGDFDFLYRGNQLDIFVAGFYITYHFILRIRLNNQTLQSARVIVTSGALLSPLDNSPHGVAVNTQGTVLTTLGWGDIANIDQPVAFGVDYPENQNQVPVYLFDPYQSFSSRGMTSDNAGNFYVASGWGGGGGAGGGASCMIFLPAALDTTLTIPLQSLFANPRDVAIDQSRGLVYMTDADTDFFSDNDAIWVMPLSVVGISESPAPIAGYQVLQNYPNPFNPATIISYALPVAQQVTIVIYNSLAQQVSTLAAGRQSAGLHQMVWDGKNDSGQPVGSGIYFYRVTAGDFTAVRKMMLLR
ncbi:MAG: FlgD immunoglobulin-like domain containing protein [Calditrichia bacterium]